MSAQQIPFDLGHTPSHDEADFVIADGNAMAHAHVMAWPEWAGPLTLLVGPAHAGKSHLARIWAERADAVFAGVDDLEALSGTDSHRSVVVEDVDRAGYDEAALFHLLNQSMRDRRPLLMTARTPPAAWPFRTADLTSRARLASTFAVAPVADIELSQMMLKLLSDRQIAIEPKIISYLVARMERSAQEAVRLVEAMDSLSLARRSAITRSIAAEALAMRREGRADVAGSAGEENDDNE